MLGPTMQSPRLPTIRELVTALHQRTGVEAVLLLGRDGMLIDGRAAPGVDLEQLAAHVPALAAASEELSATATRGKLVSSVVEYERGFAVVANLSSEAMLLVLLQPSANLGALIAEIRQHRSHIAALV